jgi:hypothetical protein
MELYRIAALAILGSVLAAMTIQGLHAQSRPQPVALTESALAGMEQVNLAGHPSKPGPNTLRLTFPAGYKLAPHSHPTIARSQSFRLHGTGATAINLLQRH